MRYTCSIPKHSVYLSYTNVSKEQGGSVFSHYFYLDLFECCKMLHLWMVWNQKSKLEQRVTFTRSIKWKSSVYSQIEKLYTCSLNAFYSIFLSFFFLRDPSALSLTRVLTARTDFDLFFIEGKDRQDIFILQAVAHSRNDCFFGSRYG
jgi:hypothetical protein